MKTITFTKQMADWLVKACSQAKISRTQLAVDLGFASTYYCKSRDTIDEERWNKTLAHFEKLGISFKVEAGTSNDVCARFRAMAAEPGASATQLQKLFGISSSTYNRIINGAQAVRVQPRLVKVFKELDGETKKLVKLDSSSSLKAPSRLGFKTAFRLFMDLKQSMSKVPKEHRQEFLQLLAEE